MIEYPRGICDLDSTPHAQYTKCRNWRKVEPEVTPETLGSCDGFFAPHPKTGMCENWKPVNEVTIGILKESTTKLLKRAEDAEENVSKTLERINALEGQLKRTVRRAEQAEEAAEKFSNALYRIRSVMDDIFPS